MSRNKKIHMPFWIFVIISYIYARISGGDLPYIIFYMFLFVFLTVLIYKKCINNHVYVDIRFNKVILNVGDSDLITLRVVNDFIIPMPCIEVKNATLDRLITSYTGDALFVAADSNKHIKYDVKYNRRGIYKYDDTTLKVDDPFGIMSIEKVYKNNYDIRVYPKVYEIHKNILGSSNKIDNVISTKSKVEDSTLIKDIRQYRNGDSLKRIHWKLSAKHGELYVKNYDYISGAHCSFFVDMKKCSSIQDKDGALEELNIDFTVSLVKYMITKNVKTNIFISNEVNKFMEVENMDDFYSLMEYFINNFSNGVTNLSSFITKNIYKASHNDSIIISTWDLNDINVNTLLELHGKGHDIIVFYNNSYLINKDNINILIENGIECHSMMDVLSDEIALDVAKTYIDNSLGRN